MRRRAWLAACGWLLLALPPSRRLLEGNMSVHMLVQLPLLAVCGWYLGKALPERVQAVLAAWNHRGISGLLLASLAGLAWMLPLALDAALVHPGVELAKFLGLPLLVGSAVALSWPRAGFVVRGLVLMEAIAMCFRIGWLYLAAPVRLCANYRIDDQQLLGRALIVIGVAILAVLVWKLLWGHVAVNEDRA